MRGWTLRAFCSVGRAHCRRQVLWPCAPVTAPAPCNPERQEAAGLPPGREAGNGAEQQAGLPGAPPRRRGRRVCVRKPDPGAAHRGVAAGHRVVTEGGPGSDTGTWAPGLCAVLPSPDPPDHEVQALSRVSRGAAWPCLGRSLGGKARRCTLRPASGGRPGPRVGRRRALYTLPAAFPRVRPGGSWLCPRRGDALLRTSLQALGLGLPGRAEARAGCGAQWQQGVGTVGCASFCREPPPPRGQVEHPLPSQSGRPVSAASGPVRHGWVVTPWASG